MKQKSKNKKRNFFRTLCTVLVTLLFAAIIGVFSYAWKTLGLSSHTVSYSSTDSDVTGILPEERKFESGDEVVVRAGSLNKPNSTFLGWKDVNNSIQSSAAILANGTVFIMPDKDVVLEPVWEENKQTQDNTQTPKKENNSSAENKEIYIKKDGKDYINIRSSYGHDAQIVTKVYDSDTEMEYSGKSETVYDEDDLKSYTWYYVSIPAEDKEGWVRSDMVSKPSESSQEDETYLKASKYETITMYEEADSSSGVIEKIDNDETALYFSGKTKETEDENGNTTSWYYMKNSDTGESGWIEKEKLEHVES